MYRVGPAYVLRVPEDEELLTYITRFAKASSVRLGLVLAIGALKGCKLGYYDQRAQRYEVVEIDEEVELVSALGNVSIREGEPFVHMHVSVGRRDGSTVSGHLIEARVFVAEVVLLGLEGGPELVREREGGLWLWRPGPRLG
ncbi:MAG: DUF296 domain-containing protein [Desulfurococcaceae archaeon]|nr:DUF296 domain-containing protein [Desulfurococcaceae archaeon]